MVEMIFKNGIMIYLHKKWKGAPSIPRGFCLGSLDNRIFSSLRVMRASRMMQMKTVLHLTHPTLAHRLSLRHHLYLNSPTLASPLCHSLPSYSPSFLLPFQHNFSLLTNNTITWSEICINNHKNALGSAVLLSLIPNKTPISHFQPWESTRWTQHKRRCFYWTGC